MSVKTDETINRCIDFLKGHIPDADLDFSDLRADLSKIVNKDIKVPLGNGYSLYAETYDTDEYKEIVTGIIKDDGEYVQDLTVVGADSSFSGEKMIFDPEKFAIRVFGDCYDEDYTEKFTVDLYKEDDEPEKDPSLIDKLVKLSREDGISVQFYKSAICEEIRYLNLDEKLVSEIEDGFPDETIGFEAFRSFMLNNSRADELEALLSSFGLV